MGCYLYGKLRRTDFLPVGEEADDEVLERGCDSRTAGSSSGDAGMEHAFKGGSSSDGSSTDGSMGGAHCGMGLADPLHADSSDMSDAGDAACVSADFS